MRIKQWRYLVEALPSSAADVYQAIRLGTDSTRPEAKQIWLDERGNAGWELVQIVGDLAYFKMPVERS